MFEISVTHSIEKALRQFKKKTKDSNIINELKSRKEHFDRKKEKKKKEKRRRIREKTKEVE